MRDRRSMGPVRGSEGLPFPKSPWSRAQDELFNSCQRAAAAGLREEQTHLKLSNAEEAEVPFQSESRDMFNITQWPSLIPGWGRTAHSSIFAWRIPRRAWWPTVLGLTKS